MQTNKLKLLGTAAALAVGALLGSQIGGTSEIPLREPVQNYRGGKRTRVPKGTKPRTGRTAGHKRTYLCGKPWIPSLDLRGVK